MGKYRQQAIEDVAKIWEIQPQHIERRVSQESVQWYEVKYAVAQREAVLERDELIAEMGGWLVLLRGFIDMRKSALFLNKDYSSEGECDRYISGVDDLLSRAEALRTGDGVVAQG